eukprot:CAMPEP_0177177062 /NCGR_PEP_ID=MMETSP0367-20130122/13594_1 /TAXON_ID=447022 ORGANISM="Scrippsiella hangoei-like, Strain SHHI-4" /NCGR_SAMPLE_ID=MMETSP0367 /ASSEMBLY_ACC=CAM_ASM_000362 /LENGTH=98 /DNA_ID=CAMNT_0018623627 /DNA_START=110 /DNA_END=406 /DNA_ORIENTATION=+
MVTINVQDRKLERSTSNLATSGAAGIQKMKKPIATSPSKSSAVANLAWNVSLLVSIDVASVSFGSTLLTEVETAVALASPWPRLLQVWPVGASASLWY